MPARAKTATSAHPAAPPAIFIAGPTAVGKSAVALALAEKIGGEIISVDSMQVYKGLDLGTAKPTPAERARVPHHLIDVCTLREPFDAARFIRLAKAAVHAINARGRPAIFCGGTGLYFQAFFHGLGEAPPADERLRAALNAMPLENLLAELREKDPATFDVIDQKNPRRVIRALEVMHLTGRKFSEQRAAWDASAATHPPIHCLVRSVEDLHRRINERVDVMFAQGLVTETSQLLERGLAENPFAMQAIGYRQVVEHLRGERNLADTIELVKIRTRQFAKRQLTWFRRYGNCRWIEIKPAESVGDVLERIVPLVSRHASG
jgi:tRNA dimethylallyltransferase